MIHWLKNVLNTVWQHKCSDGLILQFFPHWTIKFPVLLCQLTKFLFGFWALLQWISFQGDSDKCRCQSWGNEKHHWSHSWDRKILVQTYLIPLCAYDSWMNHIFTFLTKFKVTLWMTPSFCNKICSIFPHLNWRYMCFLIFE